MVERNMQFHPGYLEACIAHLAAIVPGIWDQLERVPSLSHGQSKAVVAELLERACTAQNVANIQIGRHGLSQIPRDWLIVNIHSIAESTLNLNDEWEYRRLMEVYKLLGVSLVECLKRKGLNHPNPAIREAASEFAV